MDSVGFVYERAAIHKYIADFWADRNPEFMELELGTVKCPVAGDCVVVHEHGCVKRRVCRDQSYRKGGRIDTLFRRRSESQAQETSSRACYKRRRHWLNPVRPID